MPTALSVNVNKVALLRNSRGRDVPRLVDAVATCIAAGCDGITVHPRRDQRHIRYDDVPVVADWLREHHPEVELNVECELHEELIDLVLSTRPAQCTLVPVTPGEITSDHGWTFPDDTERLGTVASRLREAGIRSSAFVDCVPASVGLAAASGIDRVELYTGPYAWAWGTEAQEEQTRLVHASAAAAVEAGMGVNAGHDLDRFNVAGLEGIVRLDEVSIGHAVIARALEVGLSTAVAELVEGVRRI